MRVNSAISCPGAFPARFEEYGVTFGEANGYLEILQEIFNDLRDVIMRNCVKYDKKGKSLGNKALYVKISAILAHII